MEAAIIERFPDLVLEPVSDFLVAIEGPNEQG
jgi:hypothetical protein